MRLFRVCEPQDHALRRISSLVPDRWIDEQWPVRGRAGRGRWKNWRTSQMVRLHLLTLVKGLGSFNATCRELAHNTDFRRFCRLRRECAAPAPGTLSKFRAALGVDGWRRLSVFLVAELMRSLPAPAVGVFVVDSTDLRAAVRRTWEKKRTMGWGGA